jgi:hypothetical protein
VRGHRSGAVVAAALLVAVWLVRPMTAEARQVSCPPPPISVADLVELQADRGPLDAFRMAVTPMNERALACFGGREIRFTAFVNRPNGLGGAEAYRISPLWITNPELSVFGSAREIQPGFGDGPFFFISTRPGTADLQARFARRWVTVQGHFGDPAARSCTATGVAGQTPDRQQAIAICRTMFVLTAISPGQPPDTSTAGPPAPLGRSDGTPPGGLTVAVIPILGGVAGFLAMFRAGPLRRPSRRRRST